MNSLPSGQWDRERMACNTAREGYLAHMHLQNVAWAYGVEQHWLPCWIQCIFFWLLDRNTWWFQSSTGNEQWLADNKGFIFASGIHSNWLTVGEVSGVFCFRYWWMSVQETANSGSVFGWTGTSHQSVFRFWVFLLNNLLFAAWTPAVEIFRSSGGTAFVLLLCLVLERCYLAWLVPSYSLSWCVHNILKLFFELVCWMVADWNA